MNIRVCQEQFKDISKRYDSNYALLIEEVQPILFWIKTVDLPELSIDTASVPYEGAALQNVGNTISFGHTLNPTFFVDEKMYVVKYFYDWIISWRNGTDYSGTKEKKGAIVLFDNNSTNVMAVYNFQRMYADSIGKMPLKNKASNPLEVSVSIKFDEWNIEINS